MILRTGKTPGGIEVRTIIKHLTKRIRKHWPATKISYRGDGHYGRPEAMEWAENNSVGFIFGQPTNKALDRLCAETADALRFRHAMSSDEKMRSYTSFEYQAGSWSRPRRVVARLESSMREDKDGVHQEMDIRYIVTSMEGEAQHLYEDVYCKRGSCWQHASGMTRKI